MSVKAWKRVITIAVILLIISLAATAVIFTSKYREKVNEKLPETMIDLEDYGMTDISEKEKYENLFRSFANIEKKGTPKYQAKYTDLYIENSFSYSDESGKKICYLTFDGGPDASITGQILDILKKHDIKATFFVTYKESAETEKLLQRMVDEGHTVGVYSGGGNYKKIYSSVTAYLKDFRKDAKWIEEITGVKAEIFRFPGSSLNVYNADIHEDIAKEMLRRGYTYYDWNCGSGDAAVSYITSDDITKNVMDKAGESKLIVRMHDGSGHQATVNAMENIIGKLAGKGYEFGALDKSVEPVRFDY